MKNHFESAECFEAYATVDACYYIIAQMEAQMNKQRSGIEKAIDDATGYSKAQKLLNFKISDWKLWMNGKHFQKRNGKQCCKRHLMKCLTLVIQW
ncbi:hypothetical protein LCGC14_0388850 [marine sediment metagenome]|uniref:Uncharacterized protein n=1 Tax=marine sediment metagenome TaxID=412755 RepID=A0A0F9W9B9_9ZZZZ